MSGLMKATVAIVSPGAEDVHLTTSRDGRLYLFVHQDACIVMGDTQNKEQLGAEAAVMRRLADVATEAAVELERRVGGGQ